MLNRRSNLLMHSSYLTSGIGDAAASAAIVPEDPDYLAGIFHQIRSLLFTIRGFTKLLASGKDDNPSRTREYLDILEGDVERLTRLVEKVLCDSADGPEKLNLEIKPIPLDRVVASVVANFSVLAKDKDISVETYVEPGLPQVMGDELCLEQVLSNLVSNAVRHSPQGSRVIIRAEIAYGGALISVQDFGPGISRDELDLVFNKYYRGKNNASHGHGLGLYIARQFVQAHGGQIWVESEPGLGSTFAFLLPLPIQAEEACPEAI